MKRRLTAFFARVGAAVARVWRRITRREEPEPTNRLGEPIPRPALQAKHPPIHDAEFEEIGASQGDPTGLVLEGEAKGERPGEDHGPREPVVTEGVWSEAATAEDVANDDLLLRTGAEEGGDGPEDERTDPAAPDGDDAEVAAESASEGETESEGESETAAESESDSEREIAAESEGEGEPDTAAELDLAAESEGEGETETEGESETAAEPGSDSEREIAAESESEGNLDLAAEPESDSEPDPVAELDLAAESESEGEPDLAADSVSEGDPDFAAEPESVPDTAAELDLAAEPEGESEPELAAEAEAPDEPRVEPKVEPAAEPEAGIEPELAAEAEAPDEPKVEPAAEPEAGIEPELAAEGQPGSEGELAAETEAAAVAPERPALEIPKDYIPAAESTHLLYQVEVDTFAGPLDLLLFLIRRHQVDIFDIPIAFICEEYLRCLKTMEDLSIDVAAEFMLMASDLLHIKSKMLLPKPAEIEEEGDEIDPRAELVRRLLEYEKYKSAGEQLGGLARLDRDVFARDGEDLPVPEGQPQLREVGVFALVDAFGAILKRQTPEVRHKVELETTSLKKRIEAVLRDVADQESVEFSTLIGALSGKIDIVVTFLAMLELTRLKLLRIYQSEEGHIYLHPRFERIEDAYQKLEGIDESYAGT